MKLARYKGADESACVAEVKAEQLEPLDVLSRGIHSLAEILDSVDPRTMVESLPHLAPKPLDTIELLPPIDDQEVWAAGVTYKRSQTARMEESAAAASCYDRVYRSERPELFFKATSHRVRGHRQPLRIRGDSQWNVPEPEITLAMNSRMQLVGLTIGNDMSSRDIEGENPLYLPQAKIYDGCCGLGPWIVLADAMPGQNDIDVDMNILRQGQPVFAGATSGSQMARTFAELLDWLKRENSFPHGVFLMTGTGIVPDNDFSLQPGDRIRINVTGIGTLENTVA